jgi:NAD(P)-dependent dehydrogenase (short-subunit alcohol dehydrogenase family)
MYKKFDVSGKTVVVTGGTGILGSLYCARFAEEGSRVVISDIEGDKCAALAEKINDETGTHCMGLAVDLSNESSVSEWAKRIIDAFGSIDVLVNNAATKSSNFFEPLERFPLDDWSEVVAVNMTGVFLAVRELGSAMAQKGKGSIINISSIYGVVGPDQRIYEGSYYGDMGGTINTPFVYSATKGAVIAMTKYLATYWGSKGVRTNTLTPGGVYSGQNEIFQKKYAEKVPLGRMAAAEDMVGALLFLASDASSYINGQNIIVDGGWTAW